MLLDVLLDNSPQQKEIGLQLQIALKSPEQKPPRRTKFNLAYKHWNLGFCSASAPSCNYEGHSYTKNNYLQAFHNVVSTIVSSIFSRRFNPAGELS